MSAAETETDSPEGATADRHRVTTWIAVGPAVVALAAVALLWATGNL